MQCPLCGGPLDVPDATKVACERGHEMTPDQLQRAATSRATLALWMAIDALESQSEALRRLAAVGGPSSGNELTDRAEEAENDANLLRELASQHDSGVTAG